MKRRVEKSTADSRRFRSSAQSNAIQQAPFQQSSVAPKRSPSSSEDHHAIINHGQKLTLQFQYLQQLENNSRVIQCVKAGHYTIKENCSLRSEDKAVITTLPQGTLVTVAAPVRTRRFSLGFVSLAKNHTWVQYHDYQGWIRDDALVASEIPLPSESFREEAPAAPAAVPPFVPSAPIPMTASAPIPMTGATRANKHSVSPASMSPTSLSPLRVNPRKIVDMNIDEAARNAFEKLHFYIHFTKEESRPGIHKEGLIPGRSEGIGFPSDTSEKGEGDTDNVYVVSGSCPTTTACVSLESGGALVVVVSRGGAVSRDVNYKAGAYYFSGEIAPGRNFKAEAGETSISLVLPLTSNGKQGLANFINAGSQLESDITPDQAEYMLVERLQKMAPLYVAIAGYSF